LLAVQNSQLIVQGPIVIDVSNKKKASSEKVEDSCEPLAHVKSVDPEDPEKGEQNPGHVIIVSAWSEPEVGLAIHRWDQKEIHDPSDEKQSQREEIYGSSHGFAVIEPVGSGETEDPKNVADPLAVRITFDIRHFAPPIP
jgi:hypothetical protein